MIEDIKKHEYPNHLENLENIASISEAFSIHPKNWFIGGFNETVYLGWMIEKISNIEIPFYVGFNVNGKPVFKIRVDCSTITYKQ